jgi:hypothetical protein
VIMSHIVGVNIKSDKSNHNSIGNRLTNPNWYSNDLLDVEKPYKENCSKILAPNLNYTQSLKYDMNLMFGLQVQKFRQNPELIDEINNLGGQEFIQKSSHIVGIKNSRWEGVGMESNFIKVLNGAYEKVSKELGKFKPYDKGYLSTIEFKESNTEGYKKRTIENASADITLAFAQDFSTAGERLTKSSVLIQGKKYLPIQITDLIITDELVDNIVGNLNSVNCGIDFLSNEKNITLNIAGNGIYTMGGKFTQLQIDDYCHSLLKRVIESKKLNVKINLLRTGGQTGFDEAGAKAGMKLGLKTLVLAPKGWKFRSKEGKDIQDEKLFKLRFR